MAATRVSHFNCTLPRAVRHSRLTLRGEQERSVAGSGQFENGTRATQTDPRPGTDDWPVLGAVHFLHPRLAVGCVESSERTVLGGASLQPVRSEDSTHPTARLLPQTLGRSTCTAPYFREFARSSSVFIFLPLSFCLPVLSVRKEGDRKREAERSLESRRPLADVKHAQLLGVASPPALSTVRRLRCVAVLMKASRC